MTAGDVNCFPRERKRVPRLSRGKSGGCAGPSPNSALSFNVKDTSRCEEQFKSVSQRSLVELQRGKKEI